MPQAEIIQSEHGRHHRLLADRLDSPALESALDLAIEGGQVQPLGAECERQTGPVEFFIGLDRETI